MQSLPALARIDEYVAHWARFRPAAEAMADDARRVTYAELAPLVDRYAKALLAAGVRHGDRVAVYGKPRNEFFLLFLAAASIGAIYVGLNAKYRLSELRYVIGDAEPMLVFSVISLDAERETLLREALGSGGDEGAASIVSRPRLVTRGRALDGVSTLLDDFLHDGEIVRDTALEEARLSVAPVDPLAIVYTSGSTGRPKGALLTHRGMVIGGRIAYTQWRDPAPRCLCDLPINHVGCLHDICCSLLVAGGTLVFREDFDPAGVLALIERERLTFWGGVPTMFLLEHEQPSFANTNFSSVRNIIWSGAAMPLPLVRALRQAAPHAALRNFYSTSETTVGVTFTDPDADDETLAGTIGRPDPRVGVRIADAAGHPVPNGEAGEIQMHSEGMFAGYWRRPDATRDALTADGWYRTGDVGVMQADGNVRLVGRLREMYKSGGYNVYPAEVEAALEEYRGVAMAAVVSVPDPLYGEVGVAYVVPTPGTDVTVEALRAFCRERLANYKVPKRFVIERELPMLPIGKVDKNALRGRSAEGTT